MPIVFEQPGPYDRNISEAYGGAQALKDFLPFLTKAYGHGGGGGGVSYAPGGGGGGRGGGGGGDGGIQQLPTDPVEAYRAKSEIDAEMQRRDRERQIAWIQQNTAPDQEQQAPQDQQTFDEAGTGYVPGTPEQEAAGGVQAPPQQMAGLGGGGMAPGTVQPGQPGPNVPGAQAPQFSQADALNLQRLESSRARVQSDVLNGKIDQATARRMIMQLQTGIDPLRMQQQAAAAQAQQLQLQSLQQANAHTTAIELTNSRMRAMAGADGMRRMPDGSLAQWDPVKQKWEPWKNPVHEERAETERQRTVRLNSIVQQETSAVDREIAAYHKPPTAGEGGKPRTPPQWMANWLDQLQNPQAQNESRRAEIRRRVQERLGHLGETPGQQNGSPQAGNQAFNQLMQRLMSAPPAAGVTPRPAPQPMDLSGESSSPSI
jgi:hypothetical protein